MILVSFLSILLNFSTNSFSSEHIVCGELIHIVADHNSQSKTYTNKYRIPVVDKNGKMMFDLKLKNSGSKNKMVLIPVRPCRFSDQYDVTLSFSDKRVYTIKSTSTDDSQVEIDIDANLLSDIMTGKIVSIAFPGLQYNYEIVLKPNQGRVVQDVMNCIQH